MKHLILLGWILIYSSSGAAALNHCGEYELEGTIEKNIFYYHKNATSEIRFKIKKSDLELKNSLDGLNIKARFKLLRACKYDCEIKLINFKILEPGTRPKAVLEEVLPKIRKNCS